MRGGGCALVLLLLVAVNAQAKQKNENPFKCSGAYGSYTCTHTVYFNDCKNSIRIHWPPLEYPGSGKWKKSRRNYCSVTIKGEESTEERKYPPEKCEQVMWLLGGALQGFPEIKWQDTPCTHLASQDGVVYTRQRLEKPTAPLVKGMPEFKFPEGYKDPEPRAVGLNDVRRCVLHIIPPKRDPRLNDQTPKIPGQKPRVNRFVQCPVLEQRAFSWLRRFLAHFKVRLVLRNEEK